MAEYLRVLTFLLRTTKAYLKLGRVDRRYFYLDFAPLIRTADPGQQGLGVLYKELTEWRLKNQTKALI